MSIFAGLYENRAFRTLFGAQIARELGLHRHTVETYVKMSLADFQASEAY